MVRGLNGSGAVREMMIVACWIVKGMVVGREVGVYTVKVKRMGK
jgi:hypothetical protein